MNNECCGSQLYHTGVCCNDDSVNTELVNQVLNAPEEKPLKDCACKGLGPCQCPPERKEKNIADQFKDMKYVIDACGCGEGCGC
ncbi:hypothetical protein DF185_02860 [Marinifilum breve]|uniref:Uncharacterized protein n=1 Tax=Marinifilum breve TaxID=2184082 RepID=A0A2V4A577_9BACT|nr:hypothetical protein [Marinifilum breve]PXY03047.1 hypothetical protein DF185_02860 [Marinifilum breve]